MKKYLLMFNIFLLINSFYFGLAQDEKLPERLKRSDSFLGIHFDFHAGDDCTEIGKNVTPEMVSVVIDKIKPDYIQVDCKGHRGLSSYPTKVGNPAPGFVNDALKIFRDVTAKKGVALFCHYSGVLDEEAVKLNPGWAIHGVDRKIGGADGRVTSVFGPYVDNMLIPQLKELNDVYNIDGVWIDGECWGMERDYNFEVIKKFQKETGIKNIPTVPADSGWYEFSQFSRNGFRQYINHYANELHAHNPNFQIASNWAFSSFMPEPVTLNVDYLSGDIVPTSPVNAARLESRVLKQQGKPWDLMSWSFTMNWDDPGGFQSAKSVIQLQQEAAVVMSHGGGFQVYFQQNRDASINLSDMNTMEKVAKFCRERQPYCHKANSVPQIGLILSTDAYYKKLKKLFQASYGELDGLNGIMQILLESQNVVDVVMEHNLIENINRYPLLIYPEWETITPEFKKLLIQYVENGGSLLVIGPITSKLFQDELGIQLKDSPQVNVNHLEYNKQIASVKSLSQGVELEDGVKPFGKIYKNKYGFDDYENAASIRKLGKGTIVGVYLNLGERFLKEGKVTVAREFLNGLVKEIFSDPIVTVQGSHSVDISLNHIDGKLAVNLVNTSGPHANPNVYVYDEIPSIGPITVSIQLESKPKKVSLNPSGQELKTNFKAGKLTVSIPRIELHEILVIEE